MPPSDSMPPTGCFAAAVVGLGPAGQFLLEELHLRDDCRLVAVCDHDPAILARHTPPGLAAVREIETLLADSAVDLVVLTTPAATHPELARAALQHGKHVLVAPPLTLSTSAAASLVAAQAQSPGRIAVWNPRRIDDRFQAALHARASGRLGSLTSIRYLTRQFYPVRATPAIPAWQLDARTGGGLLWQLGSTLFDLLLALVSAEPKEVVLRREPHAEHPLDVAFTALVTFADGTVAMVEASRHARAPLTVDWYLEGTLGSYHAGMIYTTSPEHEMIDIPVELPPGLPAATRDVPLSAIVSGESRGPFVSLTDAVRTVRLIEQLRASQTSPHPIPFV